MATTQSVKTQSEFVTVLRSLAADPLGLTGLIIVSLIFFTAIFAEWVMPYDPIALNIKERLQGPSWSHWFGTDQLGRDTLSRVIMGGRVALQVALPTIFGAMTIGITLGMIAGFGPRWLDNLIIPVLRYDPLVPNRHVRSGRRGAGRPQPEDGDLRDHDDIYPHLWPGGAHADTYAAQ